MAATRPQHFLKGYVDYYREPLLGRSPLETLELVVDLGEKQNKILGPAGLHATAVKIKIGDSTTGFAQDMKRVEAARSAIGDKVDLLVDANCACDLNTAPLPRNSNPTTSTGSRNL